MTGPIAQARRTLAEHDRDRPHLAGRVRQVVGGLLVTDGLVGIDLPGRRRPGLLGSLVGVVFAAAFAAVPLLVLRTVREEREATRSDPFFADDGPPAAIDWVLWAVIAVGVLLLLSALATVVVRLSSIALGWHLLRQGRRMAADHPPRAEDEQLLSDVRERFTALLASSGHRAAGPGTRRRRRVGTGAAGTAGAAGWAASGSSDTGGWRDWTWSGGGDTGGWGGWGDGGDGGGGGGDAGGGAC